MGKTSLRDYRGGEGQIMDALAKIRGAPIPQKGLAQNPPFPCHLPNKGEGESERARMVG